MIGTTYAPNLDILQLLAVWEDAVKIYYFFCHLSFTGSKLSLFCCYLGKRRHELEGTT